MENVNAVSNLIINYENATNKLDSLSSIQQLLINIEVSEKVASIFYKYIVCAPESVEENSESELLSEIIEKNRSLKQNIEIIEAIVHRDFNQFSLLLKNYKGKLDQIEIENTPLLTYVIQLNNPQMASL